MSRVDTVTRALSPVLLLPVVAALIVGVVAVLPGGDSSTAGPRAVPVAASAYACAGAPDLATGQVEAGDDVTARALPGGADVTGLADPRAWVRSRLSDAGDDVDAVVVAHRGASSGAVGFVSGRLAKDDGEGLVVGACPGVVDDAWFAALGSGQRHQSRLVLTNLADTPSVVDVSLWSAEGPVKGVGADGLAIDPGQTRTVELAELAAGEKQLGVHVQRRRGAVAVAAIDTASGVASGSELVSAGAPPAREQIIGGLPKGASGRTLQLLNPGDSTARITVEALGQDGTFTPDGLDDISVGAGRVATVDVPRSVGSGRVALRLTASRPVVASAGIDRSGDDIATVEAAAPWSGAAVVPVKGGLGVPELLLTAPRAGAKVVVEARGEDLDVLDRSTVTVDEGATQGVNLAKDLDLDGARFLVLRARGDVLGSAHYTAGGRAASLTLTAAPVEVLAPRVRSAP